MRDTQTTHYEIEHFFPGFGSLPVNDFGGELHLAERDGGVLAHYTGSFNPKYPGTGWIFKRVFRSAQRFAFRGLGRAYEARYRTKG